MTTPKQVDPAVAKARLREICLALPETKLTLTWGSPHFRVREKIFAGYGEKDGKPTTGFKLPLERAQRLIRTDSRFTEAPYVGRAGWVTMSLESITDWEEVRSLIQESYCLIAPKTLARQISGSGTEKGPPRRKAPGPRKKAATTTKPARKQGARRAPGK